MYAIAFDMVITDLRANYGEPYNNAYFEINKVLRPVSYTHLTLPTNSRV